MTKNEYYTYLKILDLNENATIEDIKKAYRYLVKKYHPDIAGRSEFYVEKFREITKAYKILLKEKDNVSHETEPKTVKNIVKDLLFKKIKIDNYLFFFKKRKQDQNVNFSGIFLKDIDAALLSIGEDELILRLEGSNNFYVMVEAIKALYKIKSKNGIVAIIENYYKYNKELKLFVSFLLKKRINEIENYFEVAINQLHYNTVISVISFLYGLNDEFKQRNAIKVFINNNLNVSKLEVSKIIIKYKNIFSKNELKIGEKLLLTELITTEQLTIALAVKNRFKNYKLGKIINDLGFLSYKEIDKLLKTKTIFN